MAGRPGQRGSSPDRVREHKGEQIAFSSHISNCSSVRRLWLLHFPPQRRAGFLSKTPGTGRQILRFVVGDIPSHGRRRLPALRFGRRTRRLGCPLRTLAAVAQCSAGRAFCSRLRNSFPTTWLCRSGSQTPCLRCRARPGILTAISCRGGLMNFTHLHYCS